MPLQYVDPEHWEVSLPLTPQAAGATLNYSYILRHADGAQTTDWGRNRALVPASCNCTELLVLDSWNQAGFMENVFYTEPFKKVLLAENFTAVKTACAPKSHAHVPRQSAAAGQRPNRSACSAKARRSAIGTRNRPFCWAAQPDEDYFSVQLDLRGQTFPLAYKYGVFDVEKILRPF